MNGDVTVFLWWCKIHEGPEEEDKKCDKAINYGWITTRHIENDSEL